MGKTEWIRQPHVVIGWMNEIEIIESCLSSPEQCSGKPTRKLIRHRMQHVVTEDLLVVLVCFFPKRHASCRHHLRRRYQSKDLCRILQDTSQVLWNGTCGSRKTKPPTHHCNIMAAALWCQWKNYSPNPEGHPKSGINQHVITIVNCNMCFR